MRHFCNANPNLLHSVIRIVAVVVMSICLLYIVFLGISSCYQFRSLKRIQPIFKHLFHTIWICTIIVLIIQILCVGLCWTYAAEESYHWIITSLVVLSALCAFFGVLMIFLLNFIIRLHSTFRDSIYAVPPHTRTLFTVLFIILIVIAIWTISLIWYRFIIVWHGDSILLLSHGTYALVYVVSLSAMGCLYCFLTAYSVVLFGQRLMLLTNAKVRSVRVANESGAIRLSEQQMQMIENTTRYVSLSALAIITAFIAVSLMVGLATALGVNKWNSEQFQLIFIFVAIVCIVHVVCLYLQYSFSTQHYKRYCGVIHSCWSYILIREAANALNKRYEAIVDENEKGNIIETEDVQTMPLKASGNCESIDFN
eukprot:470974_1